MSEQSHHAQEDNDQGNDQEQRHNKKQDHPQHQQSQEQQQWLDDIIESLLQSHNESLPPPEQQRFKTMKSTKSQRRKPFPLVSGGNAETNATTSDATDHSRSKRRNVPTSTSTINTSSSSSITKRVKPLVHQDIMELCKLSREVVMKQPMLLELAAPITICGDIHGQFHDLIRIFDTGGYPHQSNYLFLGDYVDRGKQSIETACLLLAYKIKHPHNFFLLRGNHEARNINRVYGFYDECKRKYTTQKVYKAFCSIFDCLPCCAIIDEKIMCMHGGLSPDLYSDSASSGSSSDIGSTTDNKRSKLKLLEKINQIQRPCDVPDSGLLCDLLWSDPDPSIDVSTLFCVHCCYYS